MNLLIEAFLHVLESTLSEWTADVDRRIYKGIQVGLDRGFLKPGDPVVVVTGWKPGSGSTNTMRVICAIDTRVSDNLAPITGITSIPSFGKMEDEINHTSSNNSVSTQGSDPKFY